MKIIIIPVSFCYPFYKDSASERFRCDWLLPYLPADKYDGTQKLEEYDVIIYQKAHTKEMVELSKKYKEKIQIFDDTDPEWLFREGRFLDEMIANMNFIVASTNAVATGFNVNYNIDTHVIPDRHELDFYKIKKEHLDKKPTLIWFGYSMNFNRIMPLMNIIEDYGFELITICEAPVPYGKFVKWDLGTSNQEIIKGDIVINLPDEYGFKSNNKTTTAWMLGMPVVEKISDIFRFLDYKERIKESDEKYKLVQTNYNIRKSADELNKLIKKI